MPLYSIACVSAAPASYAAEKAAAMEMRAQLLMGRLAARAGLKPKLKLAA